MSSIRRPLSVTIASWLIIVGGILNGAGAPLSYMAYQDEAVRAEMMKQAETDPNVARAVEQLAKITIVNVAVSVALSMLYILGGVFMVQGASWARRLTIGLLLFATAATALTTANLGAVVLVASITLLLAYCLVRKPANDFFNADSNPPTGP
jgi:hypothetical protein